MIRFPIKPEIKRINTSSQTGWVTCHLAEKEVQTKNDNLRFEKQKAEAIAKQEKQRADNYQDQLKTIAKSLLSMTKD